MNPIESIIELMKASEEAARFNEEWLDIMNIYTDNMIKLADRHGMKREGVILDTAKALIDRAFQGFDKWDEYMEYRKQEASK